MLNCIIYINSGKNPNIKLVDEVDHGMGNV